LYSIWDIIRETLKGEAMAKTQTTIRVEEEIYTQAKEILAQIGLNYSQAVNIFNSMIVLNKGLPFEIKLPESQTIQALRELENREGDSFESVDELFADLDS
jgi:DNA-damage-inducible protein J